jgi:regulatory helix-turn-helix LysR family protein
MPNRHKVSVMDLRRLRTVAAVAEQGTVSTKASRRLRVAQPALSRQISDLGFSAGFSVTPWDASYSFIDLSNSFIVYFLMRIWNASRESTILAHPRRDSPTAAGLRAPRPD